MFEWITDNKTEPVVLTEKLFLEQMAEAMKQRGVHHPHVHIVSPRHQSGDWAMCVECGMTVKVP